VAVSVLVEGALTEKVKLDDSLWTLDSGRTVVVTLEKTRQTWWACVVQVRAPRPHGCGLPDAARLRAD
jgi:hypothetical protein